uniref:Uncharacterized protein n=1 Tax=Grammatophora oceanica TaxID=210454 RepID=A0A7S1Y731_9STRA|mmetsp:Transcript_28339/g.41762  ORF Transcript_28339/g.41762 Transcript_28339/m.41762 type:complete len:196 (+) Transcript_28339:236-823(+)|eukprot:CAMPEP_0194026748 /NCGR_PEP_ID=MMETSP0009_2-20130614/1032_1 /TAXON_ID=210454 /ORGANISM="Grammatophora oceanica, Strain CCMP 410" /LENGTH=195 /DNA_ID=CAMNT_0038665591 /DNA_START=236 /DNA_END=823 /DNA_ORIENTATION=-
MSEEEKFEKERKTILKSLPKHIKDMFGIMGFCKAEEDDDDSDDDQAAKQASTTPEFVPCLVLSPYDVPPRPVRDVYWHNLYMDKKRKKKLASLEYLVYHYGANDPDDCYSFIAHEDFTTYDDGISKGYGKLPAVLQSKVDNATSLTEQEQQRVRGIEEMVEDAAKEPADRKRGNYPFLERHEEKKAPPAKRQKKR